MQHKELGELLPEEGLQVIAEFKEELAAGQYDRMDYLDVHAVLRARLRPFREYSSVRGMTDEDYFVLVILQGLGVKGTEQFM